MELEKYTFKTELHAHTKPASECSQIYPEELVENYARLGYNSVVISNHFYSGMRYYGDKKKCIDAYLADFDLAADAGEKLGIHVILGCEIRFAENVNDYLLFGIDRDLLTEAYDYLDKDLAVFSKDFRREDRVLLQAHPFRNGMALADPAYLDGIETFNVHPGHNSRVAVAAKYAREHDFIVSAGTDYHHHGHEGLAGVLTPNVLKTSGDVALALRSRNYLLVVGGNIIFPYVIKT